MAEKAVINRVTAREGEITISSDHKSNSILSSSSLTERKHIMATETIEIKVLKVHRVEGNNRIKAFVDISINDALLIKGLRIVSGKSSPFRNISIEGKLSDLLGMNGLPLGYVNYTINSPRVSLEQVVDKYKKVFPGNS